MPKANHSQRQDTASAQKAKDAGIVAKEVIRSLNNNRKHGKIKPQDQIRVSPKFRGQSAGGEMILYFIIREIDSKSLNLVN